ncbi:MAG: sulfur carrier protein ThiS adenylyltransferase ThiF [Deltaproteobacteria bacterium]|nr:sulfur carrier protein ThiS adenylyltransferase ThiF [Deltaproteobacteria bacterium]
MNPFESGLAFHIGKEALELLQSVRIGIAGAGGLGSNCAANLVRSGFKQFVIVDFDNVEYSNLNRQFFFWAQSGKPKVEMLRENLMAINPDLDLSMHSRKIDSANMNDFFSECQAIVEAFDNPECKKMIVERYMNSEKLLVAASGISGWGQSDRIKTRRIRENFFIVGDMVSEASRECPPMSPAVNIAAAKQADVVLSYYLARVKSGLGHEA